MKKLFLIFVLSFVFVMPANAQQVGDSAAGYLKELNSRRPKTGLKYNMEVKSSAGTINYLTYAQDGKWRMDINNAFLKKCLIGSVKRDRSGKI